ncbi:MAG: hypothetical protein FWE61_03645 [Micrococcales bacterium]|nr:hypothetical protein [Micrococcales bacterium]
MGLFGARRGSDDPLDEVEDIVAGRGLTGKLTRMFMGADVVQDVQQTVSMARAVQASQAAVAAGVPTTAATVAAVADTGQLMNNDPVVLITATLPDGRTAQVQALVSKLAIPRPGDTVLLVENPTQPGTLAYAGLAPR